MADIIHRIGIKAPISKVYSALASIEGLSKWWTQDTSGTSKIGEMIRFTFKNPQGEQLGQMHMQIVALEENKSVKWKCKEGPEDWIDTQFTFDLKEESGMTILNFGHRLWQQPTESMAHCSMKWAVFLMSLRQYVETGKGNPSPDDLKIDNWN